MGFVVLASKPGGDLLFHRLSDSTIGAVWFHVRVRDGIGWVTDAMATKLWSQHSAHRGCIRWGLGLIDARAYRLWLYPPSALLLMV